ncbi:hypothetical protein ACFVP3_17830 [Streptomyces sp. NPDC057806]|uniref:hypothetical protein n=1 Tax=Streptomyces sp. NPDC057806 TaxID=3346255 RepID=UPI0036AF3B2E
MDAFEAGQAAGLPGNEHVTRFNLQPGWVDLTLNHRSSAQAAGLADAALKRFNPLERAVTDRDLLDDLVERALFLNSDEPDLAAAFYTPGGVGLANLRVDSYGSEDDPRTSPAEVVPLLLDWSNAKVVGEPDVTFLDLDAGPAVRIQAMLKSKRFLGFGTQLAEFIKYAVFPPGETYMVVITTTWQDMAQSDELVRLADELVSSMRQVPVDAEGNEVGRNE